MFSKKKKIKTVVDISDEELRTLKMFESVETRTDSFLSYEVSYLRVPGGVIRTLVHAEGISQIKIDLPNTFFEN